MLTRPVRVLFFAFSLALLPVDIAAQLLTVVSASEIRGQIVRDDDGQPLEGVIVVARWALLDPAPFSLHGGGPHDNGRVIQISESVTDKRGNFHIPGWGPKSTGSSFMDDRNDPELLVFKAGFLPLNLRNDWHSYSRRNTEIVRASQWTGKILKLRPNGIDKMAYVAALAKLQEGLRWSHADEQWKSMPRMTTTLQQEKIKLGVDGERLRGLNDLFGRSGMGELYGKNSGEKVHPAIVNITWTMRPIAARISKQSEVRKRVEQKPANVFGTYGVFYVSPWRTLAHRFPGWEPVIERPPLVRVYAPGFQHLPNIVWPESGMKLTMEKLPETRDAQVGELRVWRRDFDAEIAANPNREEAFISQEELFRLLNTQCQRITADTRTGICFAPDSEVVQFWKVRDAARGLTWSRIVDSHQGTIRESSITTIAPSAIQGSAGGRPTPVRGIAIEAIDSLRPPAPTVR